MVFVLKMLKFLQNDICDFAKIIVAENFIAFDKKNKKSVHATP